MNQLKNFFLFCSGVEPAILNRAPVEQNKFIGIGATIFFTGIFAFIACAYALYTVFESYLISTFFGLLWGLMIFNLDRYIVSTMKKKGVFWRDLWSATPRLILAVLIAVVIAKPLEMKIFNSEIESELAIMQQENFKEQENIIRSRFQNEIQVIKDEILGLEQQIENKTAKRDLLVAEALAEADGTGGTMLRNMGPIYRVKRMEADKIDSELENLIASYSPQISEKQAKIADIENQMTQELASMNKVLLTGFAARLHALQRAGDSNSIIYLAGIFIMILFVAVETAPIFVKLIASRSPYDYVLDKHEHAYVMNHKSITSSLSNATTNQLDFQIETNNLKTELAIQAEGELAKHAVKEHVERLKQQPMLWKNLLLKGKLYGLD